MKFKRKRFSIPESFSCCLLSKAIFLSVPSLSEFNSVSGLCFMSLILKTVFLSNVCQLGLRVSSLGGSVGSQLLSLLVFLSGYWVKPILFLWKDFPSPPSECVCFFLPSRPPPLTSPSSPPWTWASSMTLRPTPSTPSRCSTSRSPSLPPQPRRPHRYTAL